MAERGTRVFQWPPEGKHRSRTSASSATAPGFAWAARPAVFVAFGLFLLLVAGATGQQAADDVRTDRALRDTSCPRLCLPIESARVLDVSINRARRGPDDVAAKIMVGSEEARYASFSIAYEDFVQATEGETVEVALDGEGDVAALIVESTYVPVLGLDGQPSWSAPFGFAFLVGLGLALILVGWLSRGGGWMARIETGSGRTGLRGLLLPVLGGSVGGLGAGYMLLSSPGARPWHGVTALVVGTALGCLFSLVRHIRRRRAAHLRPG